MEEGKRFIRYIIPGLAMVPQLLLFIYFYDKCFFNIFLDKEKENFGIVITTFFATGILGYIFSSVYYVIYWHLAFKFTKLDYIKIVTDMKNAILFKDYKTEGLTQNEAGATMSVCWKMLCDKKYGELDIVERTFGNILHSIGTTIMIMITGLIVGLVFLIKKIEVINWDIGWYIIINVATIIILLINYWRVANMLQILWEQSFNKLRKEHKRKQKF